MGKHLVTYGRHSLRKFYRLQQATSTKKSIPDYRHRLGYRHVGQSIAIAESHGTQRCHRGRYFHHAHPVCHATKTRKGRAANGCNPIRNLINVRISSFVPISLISHWSKRNEMRIAINSVTQRTAIEHAIAYARQSLRNRHLR